MSALSRLALPLALALPCAVLSGPAAAEVAAATFAPSHAQQLVGLDDFTVDTDWFPMDAPLQLRLIVHGGNSVHIDMPGAGLYDWDAEEIAFAGDPGAGRLALDIGLELDAKIRFDVLGLQWESDIIGPYDYAVISEAMYTPYLLAGNPERPVTIDDQTDPVTFVSVPVTPDIIVAAGNLDIDAYVIVAASLSGTAIEAAAADPPQLATVVAESESVDLLAGAGPGPLAVAGTLVCALETAPTIVLKPTLVMEILGQEFEIADIEIPIALPPFADSIRFTPVAMSFPRPPEPATTGVDSEGDSHGLSSSDSEGDSDTPTGDGPPATDTTAGDPDSSGEAGGALPPDDGGCACVARERGPYPLLSLALLVLLRRRRPR
jgi:hypothetical protein